MEAPHNYSLPPSSRRMPSGPYLPGPGELLDAGHQSLNSMLDAEYDPESDFKHETPPSMLPPRLPQAPRPGVGQLPMSMTAAIGQPLSVSTSRSSLGSIGSVDRDTESSVSPLIQTHALVSPSGPVDDPHHLLHKSLERRHDAPLERRREQNPERSLEKIQRPPPTLYGVPPASFNQYSRFEQIGSQGLSSLAGGLNFVPTEDTRVQERRAGPGAASGAGTGAAAGGQGAEPENREPKLENIVSTVNLDCELDPRKIALQAKNAEYNPKRFAAVIMRIREPKTTALIFRSGKMVCTGAKTEIDSEAAARKYAKTIKKLGFDVKFKEFTIQNIVASCSVDYRLDLEFLRTYHERFCTYDPEIFPGLIYRMEQPHIVLLLFCSGKVVLTGAKKREQLTEAFTKIRPTLLYCRNKAQPPSS